MRSRVPTLTPPPPLVRAKARVARRRVGQYAYRIEVAAAPLTAATRVFALGHRDKERGGRTGLLRRGDLGRRRQRHILQIRQ